MVAILRWIAGTKVIFAVMIAVMVLGPMDAERIGDRWQVALPLLAWACHGARRQGSEFFLRYAVMFTAAHTAKRALGGTEVNMRPGGGREGFPSAHTSTAVLGASALAHECLKGKPLAQAFVIGAAAFTGASRIEAGKHDIWQVIAGALLGYGCDRALRRPTPLRARLARWIAALLRGIGVLVAMLRGRHHRPYPGE